MFRRYLDYGVISAIRALHAQIRNEAAKRSNGANQQRANGGDHAVIEIATEHKRARHAIQLLDHACCMRTAASASIRPRSAAARSTSSVGRTRNPKSCPPRMS